MEQIKIFTQLIANELHINEHAVENTLKLLDEGCTIPFISRYRKERTGGLDEVQITAISDRAECLKETAKRKETIVKTITCSMYNLCKVFYTKRPHFESGVLPISKYLYPALV